MKRRKAKRKTTSLEVDELADFLRSYAPFILMILGIVIYILRDTLSGIISIYAPMIITPDIGALGAITFGIGLLAWVLRRK